QEVVHGHTAGAFHHLRGVPAEVPREDPEDAAGVPERLVPARAGGRRGGPRAAGSGGLGGFLLGGAVPGAALVGVAAALALVLPRRDVVLAALVVVPREDPGEVLGVEELLVDEHRGVGVRRHVLVEPCVMGEHVVDQRDPVGGVGARADRDVQVGVVAGAGVPGVVVDDRRALELGLHTPLEAHGMGLGHVGSLDDGAVGVRAILLVVRGTTTPE